MTGSREFRSGATSRSLVGAALALLCSTGLLVGCSSSKATTAPTTVASSTTNVAGAPLAGVVGAPILVAPTADGVVGYRSVGRGTPLVLLMGFGGTMDDWAPSFVNVLALRHRVVLIDNAGIGMTANVASPLTVTAMADQTSALISALGLGPSDVLGWSMGGMIAQALAVRHPAQVRRLVLAATQPGTGKSLPIPAAAAADFASSDVATKLGVLFPTDQKVAAQTYVLGILRYPDRYVAPATVLSAQSQAIQQWIAGDDPSGPGVTSLNVPTLVADGTLDRLDPTANDQSIVASIQNAQLALYPDAGHAFLFQDAVAFVPRVERFLG